MTNFRDRLICLKHRALSRSNEAADASVRRAVVSAVLWLAQLAGIGGGHHAGGAVATAASGAREGASRFRVPFGRRVQSLTEKMALTFNAIVDSYLA